jgi:hypothetical protein
LIVTRGDVTLMVVTSLRARGHRWARSSAQRIDAASDVGTGCAVGNSTSARQRHRTR